MGSRRILLVEGISDRSFFEQLMREFDLDVDILVSTSKDLGGDFNSKQGALRQLKAVVPQLDDGSIERFGLVLDADYQSDGQGYLATIESVAEVVRPFGYVSEPVKIPTGGFRFAHEDGLPDLGLWVMPEDGADGALEDWIAGLVRPDDRQLYADAAAAVDGIKTPRFGMTRRTKAKVATWLAWQKRPGESLHYVLTANLLAADSPRYQGLQDWCRAIFA